MKREGSDPDGAAARAAGDRMGNGLRAAGGARLEHLAALPGVRTP
jgi:hypothetical protein